MAPDSHAPRQHLMDEDIENGDRIEQDSSTPSSQQSYSKKETSNRRISEEEENYCARENWQDSPQWKTLEQKMPTQITLCVRKVVNWARGPQCPQRHQIKPCFEMVQTLHIRLFARLPRVVRACIFVCAFMLWIVIFGVFISKHGLPSDIGGFGAPVKLSCTNRLWVDAPDCGTDGRDCLPFDGSSFAFSCPASCSGVSVLNPRAIGNESIVYRPLVVGGGDPDNTEEDEYVYRGDSFICGAAIHSGAIQDTRGGCGVVSLVGEKSSYTSATRNGISSVAFNSSFPMSIAFDRSEVILSDASKCSDPRWSLLTLSIIFTVAFSLFTTHPATFFTPIFIITYWQIGMASDPPSFSTYPSLASEQLGNFLPAAFIAVIIYQTSVYKTLKGLKAQYEKTILWLAGLWVGALNDLTFGNLPLQRLTPHDLHQQPGAIAALIIIVLVIFAIAVYQCYCFRLEGRLIRYLGLYALLGSSLGILASIPGLELRIHHYIIALLLLPGTAIQSRPSLLFQGLLVGLFINGIARWGFDSILQTAAALQGDAQLGTNLFSLSAPPNITNSTITFFWDHIAAGYQGVSILVNDVERYRGGGDGADASASNQTSGSSGNFTWTRQSLNHPEYFRFGMVEFLPFGNVGYSDFTGAGVWWPDGRWDGLARGRTSG